MSDSKRCGRIPSLTPRARVGLMFANGFNYITKIITDIVFDMNNFENPFAVAILIANPDANTR